MLRGDQSDEELMALYQQGSEEAFQVLYSRHSGKVLGYLRARSKSELEATDLFQEVFVKIHKSKHLYNSSWPVLPWIFSVTHSVLIDGVRKTARKKEIFDFDFDQLATVENQDSGSLASVTPLIGALPENQQVALKMRYLEEKTFDEIAEKLKTSPTNVRQIISRGLKRLKDIVGTGDRG